MELLLLQTLQWRVTNATPVSFVCYLLRRLRLPVSERRRSIREHALDIVKRLIEGELAAPPEPLGIPQRRSRTDWPLRSAEPVYLQHRPSVLAAAALRVAVRHGEREATGADGVKRYWRVLDELVEGEVCGRPALPAFCAPSGLQQFVGSHRTTSDSGAERRILTIR